MSSFFKAVLVTGARQVGKTTMLKHLLILILKLISCGMLRKKGDSNAKEIDVFVEENGVIHPLEIKKSEIQIDAKLRNTSCLTKQS